MITKTGLSGYCGPADGEQVPDVAMVVPDQTALTGGCVTLLEEALEYTARGWCLFPVKPTKAPYVSQYRATSDRDQTVAWFGDAYPDALIGYLLREDEIILDVDPRYGGDTTWKALEAEFGPCPAGRRHHSGRNDGGFHQWFKRPADLNKTSIIRLDQWAREHGTGHEIRGLNNKATGRWACGIDILQQKHRYTILPPSPHLDTGLPGGWDLGPDVGPADLTTWMDLLRDLEPEKALWVPSERPPSGFGDDPSPAEWFCANTTWNDILAKAGWTVYSLNGEEDGSHWRHPSATAPFSATIRFGLLFVYSNNTPFEQTSAGDPHGITKFRAFTILEHNGDGSAAARAAIAMGAPGGSDSWTDGNDWLHLEAGSTVMVNEARDEPPERPFQYMFLRDLLALSDVFEWLIKGIWVSGSYGQLGGEKKSLKSYFAILMALSVASGVPFLGTFAVPSPGPVLFYVGEGGIAPWKRRLVRLARGMGIADLASLPIHPVFQTGQIMSAEFREGLDRNLEELSPKLVTLDPMYSYHGNDTQSSNLFEEGLLLNTLSAPCSRAGAALDIVNHFNKNGDGHGLARITQVGAQEHSDSWITLEHREAAEVDKGRFHLQVEIGSRQWGGKIVNLDMDLGSFDEDLGEHIGDPSWKVYPSTGEPFKNIPKGAKITGTKQAILEVLRDADGKRITKTALFAAVKGSRETFTSVFNDMIGTGHIDTVPGGSNGLTRMIGPGPSFWAMLGEGHPPDPEATFPALTPHSELRL